ncbi:MAG: hypothetical protein K5751_13170 [Treponemataceae bacterium]|nr:hypothetical protein [Treponemataceae bacterium]
MKKLSWIVSIAVALMLVCFVGCGDTARGTSAGGDASQTGTSGGGNSGSGTTPTSSEPSFVELETPLTLEAIEAGTITLTDPWSTLKYKKNGGDFVNVIASGSPLTSTIEVAAGDKIAFYADGSENSVSPNAVIIFKIGCSKDCYVYGNVMSLLSSSNFKNVTSISTEYAFEGLFQINTHIKNHTTKNLVLPAMTLAKSCYAGMFIRCAGLTSAPELPATTLANRCYKKMFRECTELTSAPALPATTLAETCYEGMFAGCTGLTSAPTLSATTLAERCYRYMFYRCTNLASVTCLATNISAENCTYYWLNGVAATGTFTKAASMNGWTTVGSSGIPSGWTVQNYSAQ